LNQLAARSASVMSTGPSLTIHFFKTARTLSDGSCTSKSPIPIMRSVPACARWTSAATSDRIDEKSERRRRSASTSPRRPCSELVREAPGTPARWPLPAGERPGLRLKFRHKTVSDSEIDNRPQFAQMKGGPITVKPHHSAKLGSVDHQSWPQGLAAGSRPKHSASRRIFKVRKDDSHLANAVWPTAGPGLRPAATSCT